MAADLVEPANVPQTFVHDIESAFWLLLWMVLKYRETRWEGKPLNFYEVDFHPGTL
jgi:hypothetical protein